MQSPDRDVNNGGAWCWPARRQMMTVWCHKQCCRQYFLMLTTMQQHC